MHPTEPLIQGALPGARVRCFVELNVDTDSTFREVEMRLDTVWFFPDHERLALIFHGMTRVADDEAFDVEHLLAACERLGDAPRTVEYYEQALRDRLDDDKSIRPGFDPFDLMPAELAAAGQGGDAPPAESAGRAAESPVAARVQRRVERERQQMHDKIADMGLDPCAYLPPPPHAAPVPTLAETGEAMAALASELDRARAEAEAASANRAAEIRRICADAGVPAEPFLDLPSTSIRFSAEAELTRFKTILEECRGLGGDTRELDAMLSDTAFQKRLQDAEQSMSSTYRQAAHLQPPAPRVKDGDAERIRERVLAAITHGESLAGWDLAGADLRGFDLRKADLHGALLNNANLTQANLSGCNLVEAVLAHADLGRAKLDGAALRGANLGCARLVFASLAEAELREAICHQSVLAGACLRGANLTKCDLTEAVLDHADLTNVCAPELTIYQGTLSDITAKGSDFSESQFIEVTLRRVDFSGAKLHKTAFVACRGEHVRFDGADMSQAVMTSDCIFPGVSCKETKLSHANLRGTDLAEADLSSCNLDGADLSECVLTKANLSRASARQSRWCRVDLSDADLRAANLMEAVLQKAVLRGTLLRGANLYGADLARAVLDDRTQVSGANLSRARLKPACSKGSA